MRNFFFNVLSRYMSHIKVVSNNFVLPRLCIRQFEVSSLAPVAPILVLNRLAVWSFASFAFRFMWIATPSTGILFGLLYFLMCPVKLFVRSIFVSSFKTFFIHVAFKVWLMYSILFQGRWLSFRFSYQTSELIVT